MEYEALFIFLSLPRYSCTFPQIIPNFQMPQEISEYDRVIILLISD